MFRSESPAPSIAPSQTSDGPLAWRDIDPLAQSPLQKPEDNDMFAISHLPKSQLADTGERFNENKTPPPSSEQTVTGWSWPTPTTSGESGGSSGTEEDGAGRRSKGTVMLSRLVLQVALTIPLKRMSW